MNQFTKLKGWTEDNGVIHPYFITSIERSTHLDSSHGTISDLRICLAKDIYLDVIFTVTFKNVSILRMNINMGQLNGLAIEDISDRRLEKCNYEIYDYEQGDYHLYCEDIEVEENDSK